jgi:hypothetical protein
VEPNLKDIKLSNMIKLKRVWNIWEYHVMNINMSVQGVMKNEKEEM